MLQEDTTNKTIADSLYTFGRAYMAEQKYSLALGRYDKLIKEHPRSQWIPQARKDYEEALQKLQK
jgi:outer membrane protein assembly factor BamD (BamD/ComL family)